MAKCTRQGRRTKTQIISIAARLFIDEGYEATTIAKIADEADIAKSNVVYFFPSKEHLLDVLADELCDFQSLMMEKECAEGKSSLLSYCLEITSIAAICEEDPVAKNFYRAIYTNEMTLDTIKKNDVEKTKNVFSEFCSDWHDEQWVAAENIVSGIEYATIMAKGEETPLDLQIETGLNSIMLLYGVPEELRQIKIKKVLNMDYRLLGRRILKEFKAYVEEINEENLQKALHAKRKSD